MQGWHALALLACGLWVPRGGRLADWAGGGVRRWDRAVLRRSLCGGTVGRAAADGGADGRTLLMVGWLLLGYRQWLPRDRRRSVSKGMVLFHVIAS